MDVTIRDRRPDEVDDTARLQEAMEAVGPEGGVVRIPAGTYVTSTTLVPPNGVQITGGHGPAGMGGAE